MNEKQTKSVLLSFRVTPEEKEKLERKSRGYDRMSDYFRDCVLGKEIVIVEGVDRVADELRRIGNNLNQLTRAVHMGQIQAVDLSGMRKEVAMLWQSLNSLSRAVR
ncbi:MAG: MobC family plasmid mobilization relaxosome protein [Clostridia bacterium]|nr:MobC family plasmid mobilization relaxosome protein [Clostridia bacterium]